MDEQVASALEPARALQRGCTRCPALVAARTQVVVGAGSGRAGVLLVCAAPGVAEDAAGSPVVGAAGALLDRALAGAGLVRDDVVLASLVRCLAPGARDPTPAEVASCAEHLVAEVEAARPVVVVALGGFVTKLLRGSAEPIRARRGRVEARVLGDRGFWLLPTFDPAAALYGPALAEQLCADLATLPALLARGGPPPPETPPEPEPEAEAPSEPVAGPGQLGLF